MTIDRQHWEGRPARPEDPLWIVVLAGGQGRRLATFVRNILGDTRPKQFCRILGHRSMLRHTWERAGRLVPAARVVTVITAGQERFLAAEAQERGVPGRVLVQPVDRDTGPGVLLPLLWIAYRQPDACVAVFPADHFVWEESRFLGHVAEAVSTSRRRPDRIVLLGMEPDGPETSYGWIEAGVPCAGGLPDRELFAVANFYEKPPDALAARLHAAGGLWNSFVMAGTVSAFLQLVRRTHPDALGLLQSAASRFGTSAEREAIAEAYRRLPAFNFSRDVLAAEQDTLLVHPARRLTWSDWGEPARILDTVVRIGRRPSWLANEAHHRPGQRQSASLETRSARRVRG